MGKDRKQRREEERQYAREFARKAAGRRKLLRVLGTGAGVLAGASVVGGVAYKIVDSAVNSDQAVILGEAKRRGVSPSIKEQQLWSEAYGEPQSTFQIDQTTFKEAQGRLSDTLNRMKLSENPFYREATDFLDKLTSEDRFILAVMPVLDKAGGSLRTSMSDKYGTDGRWRFALEASVDFIINGSSALTLADNIVHEAEHLKRFKGFIDAAPPNMNDAELISYFNTQYFVGLTRAIEESHGYGKQAEAYIYEAGLQGKLYAVVISGEEDRAAQYVRLGGSTNSSKWQNYISNFPNL